MGVGLVDSVKRRVLDRMARPHIAGPSLADALTLYAFHAAEGRSGTLSPWMSPTDTTAVASKQYRMALEAIAERSLNCQLSMKTKDLNHRYNLVKPLVQYAAAYDIDIQFDSLEPGGAAVSLTLFEQLYRQYRNIGYTLPSRWHRSVEDARRIVKLGAPVRVVKGQWRDGNGFRRDPHAVFIDLLRILAGRVRKVFVATHDVPLAEEALSVLQDSGTECELEQMVGLPLIVNRLKRSEKIPCRVYIPYGHPYLPYYCSLSWKEPRIIGWMIRDVIHMNRKTVDHKNEGRL